MTTSILLSRAAARASALLGACLLACVCACPAGAFTPASTRKPGGENTPLDLTSTTGAAHTTSSGGASIVRTIVGLAIVIAVIWGLSWILRQVKAGREGGRESHPSSSGLTTVAALTLGSGRSVHLVRAGNDYVLLGATEHGVAPIHRYTEEQAREAGLFDDEPAPVQAAERSRLAVAASQLVTGAGRMAAARAGAQREGASLGGFSGPAMSTHESPAVGVRPDPMRMSSPSLGVIDRLRELTVRR
jgi:flagellar protein FliO/FliZ